MIKIDKGNIPDFLNSDTVSLAIEKLQEFYGMKNRGQKRYDFSFNSAVDHSVEGILYNIFNGKCGYCENSISGFSQGVVDRFRPYNGVRDKETYMPDLYWWLVYDWTNLVYSCKECCNYKANYFPISGIRAKARSFNLKEEKKLLINPCEDSPDEHFLYSEDGMIFPITEEGNQTIELLRLNRTNLCKLRLEARKEVLNLIYEINEHGASIIRNEIVYLKEIYNGNAAIDFLAYKKWCLLEQIEKFPILIRYLDLEDFPFQEGITELEDYKAKKDITIRNSTPKIQSDYFPIEYVEILNFKGISNLRIDFKADSIDKKSWLFLLGENGVGKSSILQAIALGLKADKPILPNIQDLIKKGKTKAIITIKERDNDNIITTVLDRKAKSITQSGEFNSFLIGYGSLRLSIEENTLETERDLSKISYENIFKPVLPLNNVTQWLKEIHRNRPNLFDRVAYSIKQLLPHDFVNNELTINRGKIMFKNSEKNFSELSDGFKSTIILAVDIMMKLSTANADMDKMSGVVLIDELGNQLHPRWQMRIVKQLRIVFPNINFIISTHHPLCLRGSEHSEIVLLKNLEDNINITTNLPDIASLRVDQILSSEFFGLSSLIDPELEAKFNRYYFLLSKEKNINSEEASELRELKDTLRDKNQLGSSLRDELMYTVIDKLLAQEVLFDKTPINRQELKEKAVTRVKEIWDRLNKINND
ncbi:AAA family ATPase [Flavobacterium sp. FlaQc-47]|uniref:AAA family ATPase n=1 Tax=Flavobacterium sp. FlaQc-47 TaxID=3374180 RepID=UPI0037569CD2